MAHRPSHSAANRPSAENRLTPLYVAPFSLRAIENAGLRCRRRRWSLHTVLMGLGSAISTARQVAVAITQATREGRRLWAASARARERLRLSGRPKVSDTMLDLPGYAAGDQLILKKGTVVLGFKDVEGTATINELEPTQVRLSVSGSIGAIARDFEVALRQVKDEQAEFLLAGVGIDDPFLVRIQQTRRGLLKLLPYGAQKAVTVRVTKRGDLRLDFPLGPGTTVIVAGR